MVKEFKKVFGNRVYLILPKQPVTNIELDGETKKAVFEKMLENMDKLKVYAVGESVIDVKEGDEVYIDPKRAQMYTRLVLKDKSLLIVPSFDIMHVW